LTISITLNDKLSYYKFYSISQVDFILLSYIRPTVLLQYTSYMIIKLCYLCIRMCIIDLNYLLHFGLILMKNKLIHQYNTRQKYDFHTYVVNTGSGKRSIKIKGSNFGKKYHSHQKNQVMLIFQMYT